jgi:hypothetical protein
MSRLLSHKNIGGSIFLVLLDMEDRERSLETISFSKP